MDLNAFICVRSAVILRRSHAAYAGEEILAAVVLKPGETSSEEEIKDYVRTHMAKHKIPRYVDFVDGFPMNAAGKILKYKMRQEATERHNLGDASRIVTA